MLRKIGAVIAGYLAMFLVVFVCFTGAYLAMRAERAFQPGSYEVSSLWLVVWFVVSLAAAIAGGKVCAWVGKSPGAIISLAVIVFLLGIVSALPALKPSTGEPKPRTSSPSNVEAMMNAKQPKWVLFLTPVIGVVGVLAGGLRALGPK
jgi:hypothetical protein